VAMVLLVLVSVLNWNVWSDNAEISTVVNFIAREKPDIVCLQEVPGPMLEMLGKIPGYSLVQGRDSIHRSGLRMLPNYLVVLVNSRFSITKTACMPFKKRRRDSVFAWLFGIEQTLLGWFLGWEEDLDYQFIDIRPKGCSAEDVLAHMRIFNMHLSNAVGPTAREKQFREVLTHFEQGTPTILCGDLNVLRLKKWWGYLYRVALSDSWGELWEKENERFGIMFKKYAFRSACNDAVTHAPTECHLDYILTSEKVRVIDERVFHERFGSDHNPMFAKIEF